jgi:hypothetical protein
MMKKINFNLDKLNLNNININLIIKFLKFLDSNKTLANIINLITKLLKLSDSNKVPKIILINPIIMYQKL